MERSLLEMYPASRRSSVAFSSAKARSSSRTFKRCRKSAAASSASCARSSRRREVGDAATFFVTSSAARFGALQSWLHDSVYFLKPLDLKCVMVQESSFEGWRTQRRSRRALTENGYMCGSISRKRFDNGFFQCFVFKTYQ